MPLPVCGGGIETIPEAKKVRERTVTHGDGSKVGVTIFIPQSPRPTALLLMCVNELFQLWAVSVHIRQA